MDFYDVVRRRRSIRGYAPDPVPEPVLERIFETVNLAPTACNLQPFSFMVVRKPETKALIGQCYQQKWLTEAPVVVVALGNRDAAWKRFDGTSAHVIDVAIAMEHLVLAAAAEGLGTCWVCAFDQAEMHRKLQLEPNWDVVAITPLGTPAVNPGEQKRKAVSEIVQLVD
jgi:nitroreductase